MTNRKRTRLHGLLVAAAALVVTFAGTTVGEDCNNNGIPDDVEVAGIAIETALANLGANHASITALIPDRYDFTGGVATDNDFCTSNNNIRDGGYDMYDCGNYLNTDLAQEIPYTDGAIVTSDAERGRAGGSPGHAGRFTCHRKTADQHSASAEQRPALQFFGVRRFCHGPHSRFETADSLAAIRPIAYTSDIAPFVIMWERELEDVSCVEGGYS